MIIFFLFDLKQNYKKQTKFNLAFNDTVTNSISISIIYIQIYFEIIYLGHLIKLTSLQFYFDFLTTFLGYMSGT